MKKVIALTLAAAMALSFTACQEKKTPEEIYSEAVAKNAALTATQADMTMDMDMDLGGMSFGMTMDMAMKMKKSDDKFEMAMTGGTSLMGQKIDMEVYYKDGYNYTNAMGAKVKQAMDLETITAQAENMTMKSTPVEYLENLEMTEEDGGYKFTYTINADKMQAYFEELMSMTGEAAALPEGTDLKFESMNGTATVGKDGYISGETVDMAFSMSMEGQEVKCTVKVDATYTNPGQDFTIEFPADLDEYVDAGAVNETDETVSEPTAA